jgi:UDP-2,4-diacetamido-2,4,6-trideoxy-beta-L-altropyranose hydrolase
MNVLIRADTAVHIGSGHVMRCLTLADELRNRGARVAFVCRDFEGNLQKHIASKGYQCFLLPRSESAYSADGDEYAAWLGASQEEDAEATICICKSFIAEYGAIDWLITDHYAIGERWQRRLRPFVQGIMVIDDIANRPHDCDILLDQNLYDNAEERYAGLVPTKCRLLLGPEYALLRPEFREARERLGARLIRNGNVKRIMVFFGGSDPSNETAKAIHALQMLDRNDLEADIIVGIANPHRTEIEQLCAQAPNLHFHCQVPNMADFMCKADLALGAGGSTTWERCSLGLPTIAVIIAENQAEMTETAARQGLQWNAGWCNTLASEGLGACVTEVLQSSSQLAAVSERIYQLVDGIGASRVANAFSRIDCETMTKQPTIFSLRRATADDMMFYFQWANDPDVRRNAFHQEPILLASHQDWFIRKIADDHSYLYVLEKQGVPAGQIRFDMTENGIAEIDFSIAPEFRGQGLGAELLRYGVETLVNDTPQTSVVQGIVKKENIASCQAFLRAGFVEQDSTDVNVTVRHFTWRIDK